jgi:hypothetical protein
LHSGEVISGDLWSLLLDPEGANFKFPKLHKEQLDTVVVYADPRRMTDEFKIILSQFNKLPLTSLQVWIIDDDGGWGMGDRKSLLYYYTDTYRDYDACRIVIVTKNNYFPRKFWVNPRKYCHNIVEFCTYHSKFSRLFPN